MIIAACTQVALSEKKSHAHMCAVSPGDESRCRAGVTAHARRRVLFSAVDVRVTLLQQTPKCVCNVSLMCHAAARLGRRREPVVKINLLFTHSVPV